jgi:Transglycosylase SLT domain
VIDNTAAMHRITRCLVACSALLTAAAGVIVAGSGVTHAARPTACPQYEEALRTYAPAGGWDIAQMSAIIARESGCNPAARSARDSGLLQINDVNLSFLTARLGATVDATALFDPVTNIRAGAQLCTYWQGRGESCYFPWKLDLYRPPAGSTGAPAAPAAPAPAPVAPAPAAPAPVAGRCTQYEAILQANAPAGGWDVVKMSKLMYRTSRCNATKRWPSGTGLFRISDVHLKRLTTQLGTKVDRTTLTDPTTNVRAAATLCQASVATGRSCYRPWGG